MPAETVALNKRLHSASPSQAHDATTGALPDRRGRQVFQIEHLRNRGRDLPLRHCGQFCSCESCMAPQLSTDWKNVGVDSHTLGILVNFVVAIALRDACIACAAALYCRLSITPLRPLGSFVKNSSLETSNETASSCCVVYAHFCPGPGQTISKNAVGDANRILRCGNFRQRLRSVRSYNNNDGLWLHWKRLLQLDPR